METNQSNKAEIIAVIGSTGSGKGVFIKNYCGLKKEKRLLMWDYMREMHGFADVVTDRLEVALRELKKPKFRVAFLPSFDDAVRKRQFDTFCMAAVHAGNMRLLIEELSFVTMPSWAPSGWKTVTSVGRHRGMRVLAASQRPAQVDKAFWSNCTEIQCGLMNYDEDQKTMAKALKVDVSEIEALVELQFIHKHTRTKEITRGFLKSP